MAYGNGAGWFTSESGGVREKYNPKNGGVIMNLASKITGPADDRTIKEQLEDLGVEVLRPKNEVTGVTWVDKDVRIVSKRPPHMRIAEKCVTFNTSSRCLLKNYEPRFRIGIGAYEGKKVILLKEDPAGYKISACRHRNGRVYGGRSGAPGLLTWLHSKGVRKDCRYILFKINGGWMGVPEK
jgi:hypothetical protein